MSAAGWEEISSHNASALLPEVDKEPVNPPISLGNFPTSLRVCTLYGFPPYIVRRRREYIRTTKYTKVHTVVESQLSC